MRNLYSITTNQEAIRALFRVINRYVGNKGYSRLHRRTMVHGAISGLSETPAGYDFSKTFDELEAAFEDEYKFDPRVAPLTNPNAQPRFLAYPNVGVVASKYLISSFILSNMKNWRWFVKYCQRSN
jgi:hypothetical protein